MRFEQLLIDSFTNVGSMHDCALPDNIALQILFDFLSSIRQRLALIFPLEQITFDNCTAVSSL